MLGGKSLRCRFCNFAVRTTRGLASHIAQRPACKQKLQETISRQAATTEDDEYFTADSSGSISPAATANPIAEDNPDDPMLGNEAPPPRDGAHSAAAVEDANNDHYFEDYEGPAGSIVEDCNVAKSAFDTLRQQQVQEGKMAWAPFESRADWELAQWLVTSGVSQKSLDTFLKLEKISNEGKTSYNNARTLYQKIDSLPTGPEWICEMLEIVGDLNDVRGERMKESVEFWRRDPLECIRELFGNPAFEAEMHYIPQRVYQDSEGKEREGLLPDGATIAPVILASDKTQLSRFSGDKQAWPVYLTIGNLPKTLRRKVSAHATVLIGYIPVSKMHCFSKDMRSQAGHQFFHQCMRTLLAPLVEAGTDGVKMRAADGAMRLVFPILAAYVADHPEQCLVSCCKENRCPQCLVEADKRGDPVATVLRDVTETIKLMQRQADGRAPKQFETQGLRLVDPFWKDLPHCDIFQCFTPDLLHQLHKGVFKDHIVAWATSSLDESMTQKEKELEIDIRFRVMPSHPSLRHFKTGISLVSQWTGNEYKQMEKVFLGALNGTVEPQVIHVVRSVLDFIYYAHFESHTTSSLAKLESSWRRFHDNKIVFVRNGTRAHFNIPKIHSMKHYVDQILSKGTADGFNTELSERLHIDYAKMGYNASNKNAYIRQMTRWLTRREAIQHFSAYLRWAVPDHAADNDFSAANSDDDDDLTGPENNNKDSGNAGVSHVSGARQPLPAYTIAKRAPVTNVSVVTLETVYRARDFLWYLQEFLLKHDLLPLDNFTDISATFSVYKRVVINIPPVPQVSSNFTKDPIRAAPAHVADAHKSAESAQQRQEGSSDLAALHPARVRVIFALPIEYALYSTPLAYVEWFTPLTRMDKELGMYKVSPSTRANTKL
ncbi:unnamed protein product [Mycena citricolor]|uniref:Transposase domain-containing protein n=1 Tax=Mycena citricolor TaxID=2018698 RepID=A0AAD2Q3N0_9AGAR|nr:unnamed protein product [Mycena citricolor]